MTSEDFGDDINDYACSDVGFEYSGNRSYKDFDGLCEHSDGLDDCNDGYYKSDNGPLSNK